MLKISLYKLLVARFLLLAFMLIGLADSYGAYQYSFDFDAEQLELSEKNKGESEKETQEKDLEIEEDYLLNDYNLPGFYMDLQLASTANGLSFPFYHYLDVFSPPPEV